MKIHWTLRRLLLVLSLCCFALAFVACPVDVLGEASTLLTGIGGVLAIAGIASDPLMAAIKIAASACLAAKAIYADYKSRPANDTLSKAVNALDAVHDNITQAEALVPNLPAKIAKKVQAILDSVTALLSSLESNLHANHAAAVANYANRNS